MSSPSARTRVRTLARLPGGHVLRAPFLAITAERALALGINDTRLIHYVDDAIVEGVIRFPYFQCQLRPRLFCSLDRRTPD